MTCEHCANTVKNLILDERSVDSVEVSFQKNTAEVYGKEAMNKEHIINAVNLSGAYHAE